MNAALLVIVGVILGFALGLLADKLRGRDYIK